jgi:hypothetical protein
MRDAANTEAIVAARRESLKEREQRQYMMDLNEPTSAELGKNEFVTPRAVAQRYVEADGKFFTREKPPRVAFEDCGTKLRTSSTDSTAIADLVAVAKAKQWQSLKLSGSSEFRQEAWLQAESQGIRTTGYTPSKVDLSALEALRQERSANSIQLVSERQTQQQVEQRYAPRHDLNKNQAQLHTVATANVAANLEELKKNPAMVSRTPEALEKLAYWRVIVQEMTKHEPEKTQAEAVAKYDKAAEDPGFLDRLECSDSQAQESASNVREGAHRKESVLSL